jgi:sugar phosphate isomerase/epimerase
MPDFLKDDKMGIIVHSYKYRWQPQYKSKKFSGFFNAIDLMEHCHDIGAGGVQVEVQGWAMDFVKKVREKREKLNLYLEGSITLPKKSEELPAFDYEVKNAREAGAKVLRTVSLGPRRYEALHSYSEFLEFQKNALASLQLAAPVLKKYKIKLAVENHKDWRADELLAVLKKVDSEWIGVTLDFGNSISLLEDPMEVVAKLVPYVLTTHVKDMGVDEYEDGFLMAEVPLGKGFLDLPKIIALCKKHNADVNLNLEMITRDPLKIPCLTQQYWTTLKEVPGSDLARTLKMVKEKKQPLQKVAQLNEEELLAEEEKNILLSLEYSKRFLKLK